MKKKMQCCRVKNSLRIGGDLFFVSMQKLSTMFLLDQCLKNVSEKAKNPLKYISQADKLILKTSM